MYAWPAIDHRVERPHECRVVRCRRPPGRTACRRLSAARVRRGRLQGDRAPAARLPPAVGGDNPADSLCDQCHADGSGALGVDQEQPAAVPRKPRQLTASTSALSPAASATAAAMRRPSAFTPTGSANPTGAQPKSSDGVSRGRLRTDDEASLLERVKALQALGSLVSATSIRTSSRYRFPVTTVPLLEHQELVVAAADAEEVAKAVSMPQRSRTSRGRERQSHPAPRRPRRHLARAARRNARCCVRRTQQRIANEASLGPPSRWLALI